MDLHSIATLRDATASVKACCLSDGTKTHLRNWIRSVEHLIESNLVSQIISIAPLIVMDGPNELKSTSSQKALLIPEYSTLRLLQWMSKPQEEQPLSSFEPFPDSTPREEIFAWDQLMIYRQQTRLRCDVLATMGMIRSLMASLSPVQPPTVLAWSLPFSPEKVSMLKSNKGSSENTTLVITSLNQTYTIFPSADATHNGNERLRLNSHASALQAHTRLLRQRKAEYSQSPKAHRDSTESWQSTTDNLLGKFRGWGKELDWGKRATRPIAFPGALDSFLEGADRYGEAT
ncbi:MAG: hypothetical protein Q9169_004264 [Polycauliona sp. 2 TL-2023]